MKFSEFSKQCQESLFSQDKDCQNALKYLVEKRGLLIEFIKQSCLGYCREDQEVPGEKTWNYSDAFGFENKHLKGRLIVPLKSEFGGIVGFAARKPNSEDLGWWNTKFDKYNHMFLFDSSRKYIFLQNKAYLEEGYIDALVLKQEGLLNNCGLMGTALGYRRIGLLKRYCNDICLCFDSDANEAGQRARDRSIYEVGTFDFGHISIIDLPIGEDPDEFVLKNGLDEFLELERDLTKKEIKQAKERHLERVNTYAKF